MSNIFGDKDDKTLKEYENLTYKVYDSSTGKLEGTRTYGKSGVSITANEYAVITGIPVGTHYEVTEKQRTGYQFDNVTGEFVATTLNSTKAAIQTNKIKDTDFISCNDSVDSTISTDAETVTGNMPIANDANNAGKTVQLTYTNKEAGFTISFKYYDREVTTGTVAHINTKPTVVNYVFSVGELAQYLNEDGTYDDYIDNLCRSGNKYALVSKLGDNQDNTDEKRLEGLEESFKNYLTKRYSGVKEKLVTALELMK